MNTLMTGDKSTTLYSHLYGEAYHSKNGAIKESFDKYCIPCRVEELARNEIVTVLDVGFGLGYNILSLLFTVKRINESCNIKVVSLEKDLIDFRDLKKLTIPFQYEDTYNVVLQAVKERNFCRDGISIDILCGDARDQIRNVDIVFDAVFLDPFSVRKNPQLWTVEFFRELYMRMKESAILATYSASTPVRSGLIEAGFYIGEGPGDEMKRGGTLASKTREMVYMPPEGLLKIKYSPERIPFYDPALKFTDQEIFKYREELQKK